MNQESSEKKKFTRVSQEDIPKLDLESALKVARKLYDDFGGISASAAPHQLAISVQISPTSSNWKTICGASIAYGLTNGGYNAKEISLAEIGKKIVATTIDEEDSKAKIDAALKPRILRKFFAKYNRAKFPPDNAAKNVLETMGVPKDKTSEVLDIIKKNGKFVGIVHETKTGPFVAADEPKKQIIVEEGMENSQSEKNLPREINGKLDEPEKKEELKPIFIAYGKNKKPLEQLEKILKQFNVPYKIAVDEPHSGRPISQKVKDLMNLCGSAIFIFSKTDENINGENQIIPNSNVVFELGAASVLYGEKIIIFKEESINFPSDFSDLGHISFKEDNLNATAMELLKELISMKFVKITSA